MAQPRWRESFSCFFGWRGTTPADPAQTHKRYLKLAAECMEKARRMVSSNVSTSVQFNRRQCDYLAGKLSMAVLSAQACIGSYSREHIAECLEILELLTRLAKEVVTFIHDCCRDEWIRGAILLTNVSSEHVSWLSYDLELCTLLLRNSHRLGAAWRTLDELDVVSKSEVNLLKENASVDESKLLKDVETLVQSSNLSRHESQLANYLLERLTAAQAISTSGSPQSSQLSPWKVEYTSLEQVTVLGKGSSGTVHKTKWLGAEMAEKRFFRSHYPSFMKEISVLAGLSHPNIVPLYCYAMDELQCSIVVELMDGDLRLLMQQRLERDRTRDAPFTILEAVDIMLQAGEGMKHLHQNGVAHRDLKSSNILFKSVEGTQVKNEYLHVKVGDFGLSNTNESSTTFSNTSMDGSRWMAPELIHRRDYLGPARMSGSDTVLKYAFKSDVYSFSMICYEVLTGEVPFPDIRYPSEVKRRVLDGHRPTLPAHCPQDLKILIEMCWKLEPCARPSFAQICDELRCLKCSLLLEPFHPPEMPPTAQAAPIPDLPGLSHLRADYTSLEVKRQLGGGMSGIVYLTSWQGAEVAQKMFYGANNEDFKNEVSILARLSHPHIVRLLCNGMDKRRCSIFMELMDGDLQLLMQQRLRRNSVHHAFPFSIDEAVDIMLQIAQGVHYLHQRNVVHRDLKSHNILFKNAVKENGKEH